ncbi:gliding motility lipoprotein GldH [Bernardetia sp.]|uniref:gliding motility lipoprotein GldH n=1 Tax=Bernardetia sp. TaxID=1937974 RepID=UPI0025C007F6|nr:gliding motility lipoprotein GldH [Bernardetia sp.]
MKFSKSIFSVLPVLAILVAFLFSSCGESNNIHREHIDVNAVGFKWNMSDEKTYKVNVEEAGNYDISIELRHGIGVPYKNVLLILTYETPDGQATEEKVDFTLRDENNQPVGSGVGDTFDTRQVAMSNFKLEKGTYTFKIRHAVPQADPLSPILEVGLVVDKVKK